MPESPAIDESPVAGLRDAAFSINLRADCGPGSFWSSLADWLETTAKDADASLGLEHPEGPCCEAPPACHGHAPVWFCDRCSGELGVECHCWDAALATARAYLAGAR